MILISRRLTTVLSDMSIMGKLLPPEVVAICAIVTAFALVDLFSPSQQAAAFDATTFTVTNTADSGPGSLRQAILDANGNPGTDTIAFNISGSGVHTISPTSALPNLIDPW